MSQIKLGSHVGMAGKMILSMITMVFSGTSMRSSVLTRLPFSM